MQGPTVLKRENLERAVNDGTRKITLRGKQAIVPLKFDKHGKPATSKTLLLKRLSLDDLRFLQLWREADWDCIKAASLSNLSQPQVERLIKKLQCFREEDAQVRALAEIPTPDWITAKHVENVYAGGTLEDSEHKSLAELAKIEGAYKQTAPTTQINIWNLPDLPPEQTAKLKEVFDTVAVEPVHDAA